MEQAGILATVTATMPERVDPARTDAIIVSYRMVEAEGWDVIGRLRALTAPVAIPVLYLAANWQRQHAADASNAGCNGFLARPVRQSQLERGLSQLLIDRNDHAPSLAQLQAVTEVAGLVPVIGRVLLAEDNMVNQRVAVRILERMNAQVEVAANGAEAVAAASRVAFDLILMDCQMPEMDGFQATAAIRASAGPSSRTPIIALTANAMQGDRERCVDAGMDDYLAKPVRSDELARILGKWTQRPGYDGRSEPLPRSSGNSSIDAAPALRTG